MSENMNHKRKQTSYYRGHSTYYNYETEKWYYEDNDKYIKSENRPCTRCGKTPTLSGADYCLKDLEVCDFINAACCSFSFSVTFKAVILSSFSLSHTKKVCSSNIRVYLPLVHL